MTRKLLLCLTSLALGTMAWNVNGSQTTTAGEQELRFRVLLNDKEIGFHSFRVDNRGDLETVDIEADFDVTFLAIPVYSYDHRNREVWVDGCLDRIASMTDDNGDRYQVEGQRQAGEFVVSTGQAQVELQADCVMTFAYWNPRFLGQSRLLNAQTGEYLPIEIVAAGSEQIELGGEPVAARRYNLRNRDQEIDISIWYRAESDEWLSLESRVDGRVIRYLPAGYDLVSNQAAPQMSQKR